MFIEGIEALDRSNVDGWRVFNNEITCPNGSTPSGYACMATATATNVQFLGNDAHDSGTNCGAGYKLCHGVYFSMNSNHIDVGRIPAHLISVAFANGVVVGNLL